MVKRSSSSTSTAAPKARRTHEAAKRAPADDGALSRELRRTLGKANAASAPSALSSAAASSWETDEAAPFPRGGGTDLTPLEYKAVVQQAHQDVLFSEAAPTNDDEAAGVAERRAGGGTSSTAELVRARGLKRQDFVTGMRVLGAVSEVSSDRLLLQLPNRHTGRINRSEAGGFLHKTKWVPPERVPSEGLAAGGGSAAADPTASAARWRPYLCSVVSGGVQQPRKPVQLASVGAGAPPLPLPQDTALRFEALQPGMVVSAQIAGFLADGLRLVFCGYFEGTVACDALGVAMPMTSPQWAKRFTVGAKVSARLLWVLPAHKAVGLSLVPSLVACIPYTPPRPLGSLVQTTTCIVCPGGALIVAQAESDTSGVVSGDGAADDDTGRSRKKARSATATEEMGEGASGTLIGGAWVARSQLDLQPRQKAADALRQLKVGARHRGVVMGIRWLEGLLEVSLRPSALSQTWLRYEQVAVGHVLKGTIARIDARGARVRLGRGVYGTCGAAHLTERRLQRPQEKFSTGQAVQCLVLESEPLREKLVLSLKTALVTSTLPRVTRYEDATPGLTTHGVVAALRPRSITIRLLGGVSGIVRGSELKARFGALWESEPTACYREGQVVSCTVISCDPAQRKMLLTLLSAEEAASRPAGALLNRAAAGKKETTDKLTADQPAKKRKERPGAAEAEAEGDVSWTSRLEEAVEGRHSLATAVALGDHGQLVCRLDRKGAVRGRIHMTELADVGRDAVLPTTVPDEPIHVVVVGRAGGSVELSMRPAELGAPRGSMPVPRVSMSSLAAGQIHPGWVRDVSAEAVWVCLSYAATGRVVAIEASDDPKVLTRLAKHFRVGMAVTVRVLGTGSPRDDGGGIQLDLSLRLGAAAAPLPATSSKTASKKGVAATTASAAAGELAVGAVVPAKIVRARPGRGLDVQLGAALYGRAHATEICDEWVAEPLSSFEPGQFVRAVVLAVPEAGATGNGGGSGIEVSLRSAAVAAALAASGKKKRDGHERVKDAGQVEEGELVRGYVKAISAKGCFVSLSRTVDGFVGLRHLSDEFVKVEAVSELVPVGSLVVARALPRKGVTRGALPLSLRRSDVEGGAYLEPEASLTFDALHAGMVAIGKVKSVTEFGIFVRLDGSTIDALCHKTEVSDRKVGNLSEAFPLGTAVKVAILKVNPEKKQVSGSMPPALSASFVWDDDRSAKMSAEQPSLLDGAVEAEMEPAGGQTSRKGRRAQEAAAARDEEAAIAAREAELGSAPRSAEDFERLLLGSPNSSYMWMRYISFQLNLTEIERARQVGERALRTIALTEHKERFNIHAALLNLEKAHGDEETLAAAVARALQGCDPKQVYLHVASMHERAGDALLADAAFEVAAKKFRPHSDVWIAWMTALMARGVPAQAKAILQRAVDALPRASHVEVISKFAQLEFRYGLPERGRTVFDGVLANYPKRVDVWSIYIDMQLRQAEPESTRRLFERVTSLRLSSKKMKYFFSRYLKYARESGDAQLVAHVKEKARAWVESAAGDREPPK
ncbi:protein rrp5-like protein [Chrysochromulina tobinii]|uniref:Protein rrp5-like protein n=1 Tax=Chrysochromulina tobinii TaxID=1460289 RepID=A0A0M0JC95_9EUKA|nr:protein rrp5-like protein [Chrysochromulina tobinii]|eukprot:KOO24095.1 protein rrp5-like protein [Chrysochromulina sp. CCMP291]